MLPRTTSWRAVSSSWTWNSGTWWLGGGCVQRLSLEKEGPVFNAEVEGEGGAAVLYLKTSGWGLCQGEGSTVSSDAMFLGCW